MIDATIALAGTTTPVAEMNEQVRTFSRLYWVFRHGQQIQRAWNELTAKEREYQIEAQHRAAYNMNFHIYE